MAPDLSANALKVLQSRYLQKRKDGSIAETPDEMFRRVAHEVSQAELTWGTTSTAAQWEEKFYDAMHGLFFLPNSPTLMNAGTPINQLSACFVLPVEDHLKDIFTTLKHAALIQQSGGGTGFNFSHLRPKDDFTESTSGIASGPVSFMKLFDAATEHVRQGGKRRGANMGILNIDHPDIREFIFSKQEDKVLRNFNISIGITDSFMSAVTGDKNWSLLHPNTKAVVRKVKARDLWESITSCAWLTGDPGLIFLDTINATNPTPHLGKIESTNPCGEVPLLPYEACNLASINLSKFVHPNKEELKIDWEGLKTIIPLVIRFLDNVVETNRYLIEETEVIVKGNRKIGLGLMGWAEMLSLLEIPYDSEKAAQLAETIMAFIQDESNRASAELSKHRGVFPNWSKSVYSNVHPLRNATRTAIAPTGTISIIAGTSSSIEPFFAMAYERHHVLEGEPLAEINNVLVNYLMKHNLYTQNLMDEIRETGTLHHTHLPTRVKRIFRTALEIAPAWHLRHQVAFQKFTDNAVSKTINLPTSATEYDVDEIYRSAWEQKAKGITVFRYKARKESVMQMGIKTDMKDCKVCIE